MREKGASAILCEGQEVLEETKEVVLNCRDIIHPPGGTLWDEVGFYESIKETLESGVYDFWDWVDP